ncbi:MAG: phosphopentomutase [Gammaproteobacteria bacterium]|nr:phosphopentomutase [Gammaproteobacteria bacterium]
MSRAILIVLDSFGVGGAPDAASFGDLGSDTLRHIAERCASGDADCAGVRHGSLHVPNLRAVGLGECCRSATGCIPPALATNAWTRGAAGSATELSTGKDSQSGHWEIAGVPVDFEWTYFPDTEPSFPAELIGTLCARADLPGILGNKHASGIAILDELGEAHLRTGKPICYTSADSVFQIAAHEEHFGLERLYRVCEAARALLDPLKVGRVIARPFVGTRAGDFSRTLNRRDYGVVPPPATLLHRAEKAGRDVVSLGKIGDLFCHTATGRELKAADNDGIVDQMLQMLQRLEEGGLLFANLVDFDTLYGHRRDPIGYAAAIEAFDTRLPELFANMRSDDLAVITGDHGCDPTWRGTDHTRERVPVMAFGTHVARQSLGSRSSFADIGATIARHLGLPPPSHGIPFRIPL